MIFLNEAWKTAQYASQRREIPIGSCDVSKIWSLAKGYNQTEKLNDVTPSEMTLLSTSRRITGSKVSDLT